MDATTLKSQLEEYLKANPNPYIYGGDMGKSFEGFHSDSWTVGGLTGGNCWGSDADQAVRAEEAPEFNQLDQFLETYYPKITFLQYKKLLPLIKTREFTVGEYYGNYTDYRVFYVTFEDIIDVMANLDI